MRIVESTYEYSFENLLEILKIDYDPSNLNQFDIPIGFEYGAFVFEDFHNIPSAFVTGTTGSGKTSFMRTLLAELMTKYSAGQVRFLLFDSRGVDYNDFSIVPHSLRSIIHDQGEALSGVRWLAHETQLRRQRYGGMYENLSDLPHIFVVMDDFSELFSSTDAINEIVQLVQLARSVNIHYFIVTSIPTTNVVPTELMANMVCKYAFRVSSRRISQMVLDSPGAESLDSPGELIAKSFNGTYMCGAVYLDDQEIGIITNAIADSYSEAFQSIESEHGNDDRQYHGVFGENPQEDDLFPDAVELVLDMQNASVSLVQKKLRIGYARAARLVDMMESAGYVSEFDGFNPRRILISRAQWQAVHPTENSTDINCDSNDDSEYSEEMVDISKEGNHPEGESCLYKNNSFSIMMDQNRIDIVTRLDQTREQSVQLISFIDIIKIVYRKPRWLKKGSATFIYSALENSGGGQQYVEKQISLPVESKEANDIQEAFKKLSLVTHKPLVIM